MKTQTLLGALLTLQVVAAAGLFLGNPRAGEQAAPRALLDFPVAQIDRIVIDDRAATSTLQLDDTSWQLAGSGLPANQARIRTLLENLDTLETRWPVVSTAVGRERFEVTAGRYQRKLQLYAGDELLGEYYFGTSPGFRQTHGRRADEDEVYALAFNNFDLPADQNDWLDKSLLSTATPTRIEGPDFAIAKADEQWQLADDPDGEARALLNTAEVDELVQALGSLRVLRLEEAPAGESVSLAVTSDQGEWRYEFLTADDKYYVRRSDREQTFTISETDYERIAGKNREELVSSDDAAASDIETEDANV